MATAYNTSLRRPHMARIQKVIFGEKVYYIKDSSKDYHTEFGLIKAKDLKKKKAKTNTGKEFFILEAGFIDNYRKIKRGAQIITPKDAGVIITETGIGKKSKVLEAGGGSGGLTVVLGNICGEVITYEQKKEFVKIIKENVEACGLTNVKIRNKNVTKRITEKNLDLVMLDMLNPEKVVEHATKSLKQGGFLAAYLPSVTQIVSFVKKIEKTKGLVLVKVLETIQREWKISGKIARPEFRMLGHTGFLVISRKIN